MRIALFCLVLLAACGGGGTTGTNPPPPPPPPPPGPAPVFSVTLNRDTVTLFPGQTVQLSATTRDQAGNTLIGRTVAWSTSAASTATVSGDGLVTAAAAGLATITAASEGKTGTAGVTVVPVPVATVTLSRDTATLVPAQTLQLQAVLKDQGGTTLTGRAVTWTSSAQSVATVSTSGLVTALTAGTTTITASSEGQSGATTITVRDGAVIGAAGGSASTGNGAARVTVPAGALAGSQAITIAPAANPAPSPFLVAGTAFDFGPSGTFAQPLTMTLSYAGSTVPAAVDPSTLKIHRLTGGAWVPLPGSTVDQNARTVTAQTSSFSTYAVLGGAAVQQVVITFDYGVGPACSVQGTCGLGQLLSWTVPDDVFTATFELWGASGGGVDGAGTGRGKGGKATATISVYPGEVMQIRLGQAGGGTVPSKNGGAGGGPAGAGIGNDPANGSNYCPTLTTCFFPHGYGGGGETDVRRGSPVGFDVPGWPERVLVAGGGGGDGGPIVTGGPLGGGGPSSVGTIIPGGAGGLGGGLVGGTGAPGVGTADETAPVAGTGGSQLAGGVGGLGSFVSSSGWQVQKAEDGTAMWGGGRGGIDIGSGGGGGGGGWFGGGGGGATGRGRGGATGAGGGGGSSYGPAGSVFIQGVNSGNGRAVLTYTPSPGLQPTVVTVTSDHNPATASQPIVFTATVSLKPPATGQATGSVVFEVDGAAVGSPVVLVNGKATSNPVSGLQPGGHSVRAIFQGTSTLAPSAGNLAQNIQ